jgi:phospholipase/carboxylesterase
VRSGYGWFPLDLSLTYDQIASVAHEVLGWVEQQAGFSSIGVLGFSQGSTVATHCMRLAPDRFAYGVVLSGFVVPAALPGDEDLAERRVPVFAGRGTADTLVPQVLVTFTDAWLAEHTDLTSRRYPALGHNVSDAEIDDLAAFLSRQILPRS